MNNWVNYLNFVFLHFTYQKYSTVEPLNKKKSEAKSEDNNEDLLFVSSNEPIVQEDFDQVNDSKEERIIGKKLYDYQKKSLNEIFERLNQEDSGNILFQLPTGGGKTVIFSEITRKYIADHQKKVMILTHRIELCKQTSNMLHEFEVNNKIIDSNVKALPNDNPYMCYVAMVETLNNRLNDEVIDVKNVGLIIIDEAHYNSFTKLFKFFENSTILGVTATPLSSNMKLPMKNNYRELIVGESIPNLIKKGFLAKPNVFTYDVGLTSLKIGMNGDYTVKSSEALYTNFSMREKLLYSYNQRSKGKKTLIFNNGIKTSIYVYNTFREAGLDVRHLDNTHSKKERQEILHWFRTKPDAILSSVSILTTGFDEPTVETVILNRATRSLTLYFQMIGRGSRVLDGKTDFNIIDLGNNVARFGAWDGPIDWKKIFRNPDYYLESLIADAELERRFKYVMPDDLRAKFANSEDVSFNIEEQYDYTVKKREKPQMVLERSIAQHKKICIENSEDLFDAWSLARLLTPDIAHRVKAYGYCITKSTLNYRKWLQEEYMRQLRATIKKHYDDLAYEEE